MSYRLKNCAILTIEDLSDFECYDEFLIEPMKELNWSLTFIPWDKDNINWNDYRIVIIRSTWDYQKRLKDFLLVLRKIENSSAVLINPLNIVEWNIDKKYLYDLKRSGIEIVPSIFQEYFNPESIFDAFNKFQCKQLIVKPTVGANADNIFLFNLETYYSHERDLINTYSSRALIIQPFIDSICSQGEYSLIYFGGIHSHTILKKPKTGDFRSQEEHGGIISLVQNTPTDIKQAADKVVTRIKKGFFYARIDLLYHKKIPVLIEIELIEPSLYFNLDPLSSKRFAIEFDKRFGENVK